MSVVPGGTSTTYYLYPGCYVVDPSNILQPNVPITVKDSSGATLAPRSNVNPYGLITLSSSAGAFVPPVYLPSDGGPVLYSSATIVPVTVACGEGVTPNQFSTLQTQVGANTSSITAGTVDTVARAGVAAINATLGTQPAGAAASLTARLAAIDIAIATLQGVAPIPTTVTQLTWAKVDFAQAAAPPVAGTYSSIPGYPGAGKFRLGMTSAAADFAGFDSIVYGAGGTAATTTHCTAARRYGTSGPLWSAGEKSTLQGLIANGRVPTFSFKNGPYTFAQVAAGVADADWITTCTFIKTLTGPIFLSYFHEVENPMNNAATPTDQASYRAAYRHIIDVARAQGVTNVAWSAPLYMSLFTWQTRDFKLWHPEWSGTAWLTNADGTRQKYLDILGIDYYNPYVDNPTNPFNTGTRNRDISADLLNVVIATYLRDGGRPMPMTIGEQGVYNYLSTLEADGMTPELMLSNMVDDCVGHPTMPLINTCFWNNSGSAFTAQMDPLRNAGDAFGPKTTAVRNIAAGLILRTTGGGRVTAATPAAQRVWVADTLNRVVSA